MPSVIPGLPAMDSTLGACLIGLLIATFLEGVLTTQTYVYFNQCDGDRKQLKFLVAYVWVLDTLHLFVLCTMVYNYTITNYANPAALLDATWGFDISVFLTSMIACTIQMYFAWRTWHLTKSIVLTFLIILLSAISVGTGFACGVLTFTLVQFTKFVKYRWLVSLWLASAAGCDILIAGTLSWTLWNSRTGFKDTDTLLTRLIVWTMNTGLLTTVVAVLDIVFFDTIDNLVYFAFNMMLGKLYANMFIATLNRRLSNRSAFEKNRNPLSYESHSGSNNAGTTSLFGRMKAKKGPGVNVFVTSETATFPQAGIAQPVPLMEINQNTKYINDGSQRSLEEGSDHKPVWE